MRRLGWPVVVGLLAMQACKLTEEVVLPPSDPFLVVHGILNTRETRQFVTVERAPDGTGVTGAIVRLTHLNPVNCASRAVELMELAYPQPGVPMAGVYLTRDLCPLRPGDRVALRVETSDGKIVTGTTRIPGATNVSIRATTAAGLPPATIILDRSRDTISVGMLPLSARAMQVEAARSDLGGVSVTYRLATDSMGLKIAGDLVDPFDGIGRTVFRAGAYYQLTVAALDTNYFDFVRSGSNPFTGRGFINRLTGGVGVFGSVAPFIYELKVKAPQTDPREGVYRITGTLSGVNVDITWDLYRDALTPQGNGFTGFVDGTWVGGPIRTSANARFEADTPVPGQPASAGSFSGQIYETPPDAPPSELFDSGYVLVGYFAPGQPFALRVTYLRSGVTVSGTVTAQRISGP